MERVILVFTIYIGGGILGAIFGYAYAKQKFECKKTKKPTDMHYGKNL